MMQIAPFQDESTSLNLDQMTVENRLDRIEFYGSLQITRDQAGLRLARELKSLLDAAVAALEKEDLPEQIESRPVNRVANPFR